MKTAHHPARTLAIALFTSSVALATLALSAAEPASGQTAKPATSLASLAFLTGTWRGTSTSGATAEEVISTPEGGVMLSAGREFKGGKCIFFDLVVFTEKNGTVMLIPHPNGKRSPHTFPLVTLDPSTKRATFENKENDFPKTFDYELVASDHLRVTLTGIMKGQPASEIYDLRRSP